MSTSINISQRSAIKSLRKRFQTNSNIKLWMIKCSTKAARMLHHSTRPDVIEWPNAAPIEDSYGQRPICTGRAWVKKGPLGPMEMTMLWPYYDHIMTGGLYPFTSHNLWYSRLQFAIEAMAQSKSWIFPLKIVDFPSSLCQRCNCHR